MANGQRTGTQKEQSQFSRLRLAKGRIRLRKHAGPLRDSSKGRTDFELRQKVCCGHRKNAENRACMEDTCRPVSEKNTGLSTLRAQAYKLN
jgi:hypothetical protein